MMTHKLIALWNNVIDRLPNDDDWVIVRCINVDAENDFYFMAHYFSDDKSWNFFDEGYDTKMQVTHWQKSPKIKFNIPFTLEDKE